MQLQRSKISSIMDILLPVLAVVALLILMIVVSKHVVLLKNTYAKEVQELIRISLVTSYSDGGLADRSEQISKMLNASQHKEIHIYDDIDDNPELVERSDKGAGLSKEQINRLNKIIPDIKNGIIDPIGSLDENTHYQFIYVPYAGRNYLIVCMLGENIIDFEWEYVLVWLTIFIILAFSIKMNLVDKMIYIKILTQEKKRLVDNFGYRVYDEEEDSKEKGE